MAAEASIYIVFDGPPSDESARFVEAEDEYGHALGRAATGAGWQQREDGYWTLGPFAPAPTEVFTERERIALCLVAAERSVDRSGAAWEETDLLSMTEEEWKALHFKLKGSLTLSARRSAGVSQDG